MPQFSPTFIKVDPVTGLTFYDFDGHIHAVGLDLDASQAGPDAPAVADKSVRWARTADGTAVASVSGGYLESASGPAWADLTARSPLMFNLAYLVAQVSDTSATQTRVAAKVSGVPGDYNLTVIDGNGGTAFMRYLVGMRAVFPGPATTVSIGFTVPPSAAAAPRTVLVIFGGTCFANPAAVTCALDLRQDGNGAIGSGIQRDNAFIFANNVEHLSVVGVSAFTISAGAHQFQLEPSTGFPNTQVNASDWGWLVAFLVN